MVTDELREYVRQALSSGYSRENLKTALQGEGWSEEDIRSVLEPSLPDSSLRVSGSAAHLPTDNAVPGTIDQPSAAHPQEASSALEESHTEDIHPQRGNRKKYTIMALVFIAMLFLGGGAVLAYMKFFMDASPSAKEVFARMPDAMKAVHSVYGNGTLSIKGDIEPSEEYAQFGVLKATFDVTSRVSGQTKLNVASSEERQFDGEFAANGFYKMGALQFNIDALVKFKLTGDNMYLLIEQFPEIPFVSMYIDTMKGKWIKVPVHAIAQNDSEEVDPLAAISPIPTDELPDLLSTSTREAMQKYEELVKTYPLFDVVKTDNAADQSPAQYHYFLKFNKENFRAFHAEATAIARDEAARTDPYYTADLDRYEKMSRDILIDVLTPLVAEMWISKDDALLRKVSFDLPYATTTPYGKVHARIVSDLLLSKHNEPFVVAVPTENVFTPEELQAEMEKSMEAAFPDQRRSQRDVRRVSDLSQIQLALELYYDEKKGYPPTLQPLIDMKLIPSIPNDPKDNSPYRYVSLQKDGKTLCTQSPCAHYVLGALLDSSDNLALETDEDIVLPAAKFSGDDRGGCSGEAGRYCFDISSLSESHDTLSSESIYDASFTFP